VRKEEGVDREKKCGGEEASRYVNGILAAMQKSV